MAQILAGIEHLVVVVLENRSLDNVLGTLHTDGTAPSVVLPAGSATSFDGLRPDLTNPANPGYFDGGPPHFVPITPSVKSSTVPDPDPEETFTNVTFQIFGPDTPSKEPRWPMQGFVVNYAQSGTSDATQVPILWALARNYAASDAWFASVPSQTWPNRALLHAGTSNGHVDNGSPPDPLDWYVPTIFNVLDSIGASWTVYHDTD